MTTTLTPRLTQIEAHGVDRTRYPFASFCFGRGWRGHRTEEAARKAAARDAAAAVANYGGGLPQHMAVRTDTGAAV